MCLANLCCNSQGGDQGVDFLMPKERQARRNVKKSVTAGYKFRNNVAIGRQNTVNSYVN